MFEEPVFFECQACGKDIEVWSERRAERGPKYCSQSCVKDDRVLSVPDIDTENTSATIRVSEQDREALREILLGQPHDETLIALNTLWGRWKEGTARTLKDDAPRESYVSVSPEVHQALQDTTDSMRFVSTVGEAVSVLVANYRRWE